MTRRVAIVGAGYAGLAAGVELAAAGIGVDVFEASRTLGGRARRVDLEGTVLDNGAHLLSGAYRETLRLMQMVGSSEQALLRLPLRLEFPGSFRLRAPKLPAPLHLAWALLTAQGLSWHDKLAAITFMRGQQQAGFRLSADTSVAELLADQPGTVRHLLWDPLCLAALNTPPDQASAKVFLNVLRDSLAAGRAASDLLLPRIDFSALFPEPAARFIAAHGGRILSGTRITEIAGDRPHGVCPQPGQPTGFILGDHGRYDQVIVAVAPQHLTELVAALPGIAPAVAGLDRFRWEPILTCYLAYPKNVRLPQPMLGVLDGTAQWLLDRGQSHGQAGLLAAVISASHRHREVTPQQLGDEIHREIARIVPDLPPPEWTRSIVEKRATFACTPGLIRPTTATPVPGLWLAGDYIAGDYPATLEGAVRSGIAAASAVRQAAAHQA